MRTERQRKKGKERKTKKERQRKKDRERERKREVKGMCVIRRLLTLGLPGRVHPEVWDMVIAMAGESVMNWTSALAGLTTLSPSPHPEPLIPQRSSLLALHDDLPRISLLCFETLPE